MSSRGYRFIKFLGYGSTAIIMFLILSERGSTLDVSFVYRHQTLASKVDPHAERVNDKFLSGRAIN